MIVIDASAIVAIFLQEPGFEAYVDRISNHPNSLLSPVNALEARIVLTSRGGPDGASSLDLFCRRAQIVVAQTGAADTEEAFAAFLRFGKGRGSRARLNLGDCFAYALASRSGLPLLFKGGDFIHTDLQSALTRP